MKKMKPLKNAHTSNSKIGMGDFYGTGVKNPMGTMREELSPKGSKTVKKAPRSLA